MSTRLRRLQRKRIYETLAAIISERTCKDDIRPDAGVLPEPLTADDFTAPCMLVRWPPIGERQLIVGVVAGHTTVYLMDEGRPWRRFEVDPSQPRADLLGLVNRGWIWCQGGKPW